MTTVLITGAGSGIGAAVVTVAATAGFRVAAVDIDSSAAERSAAIALAHGAPASMAVTADVAHPDAVDQAFALCRDELGTPQCVLVNAGIERNAPAHLFPVADWRAVLDVNLSGAFWTARAGIREMLAAQMCGSIVCTSSPAAFVGFAGGGNAAYAASKGGLSAMVRSLAIDYAADGIRVNAVVPGATDTPLLTVGVPADQQAEAQQRIRNDARTQIPLQRMAQPAEIAAAVLWLWSEQASYVTGTQLSCDGGLLARSANTF